jgi:hypothetical protein
MFGCGDTVGMSGVDVRLRATERLKNAKKVGVAMRLSYVPVSGFRYPCVSTWLEWLFCAWLCFASCKRQEQAREKKHFRLLCHEYDEPIITCEAVIISAQKLDWVSHCGLRRSAEPSPSRSLCACR